MVPFSDYEKLRQEYEYVKGELAELKRLIFGSKSERFVSSQADNSQLSLFDLAREEAPVQDKETISYTRNKVKKEKQVPVRVPIASHFPRVEQIIDPKDKEEGWIRIGEEITEILEYNPAQVYVRRIIRPKYARPDKEGIVIAEMPSLPIPKANAGASILAHIQVSKFVDHLPFYRQIQIFKRQRLEVNGSTLNGWFNKTADLLVFLYEAMEKKILQSTYLQVDESPIGVQDSHKKGALHTGYQWVYHSPIDRLALFRYHPGREKKAVEDMLADFNGSVQTDGYPGYQNMKTRGNITLLGCMAHARRYFEKALDNDAQRAEHMLSRIQALYAIERKAREKGVDFETRRRYRRRFAKPILAEMENWLQENLNQVLPKSAIGKAIAYSVNHWKKLCRYIEDGKYEIDNNLIENTIRPLALGRKNYLFAGSHDAAQKAAMMYSFFATCKINTVDPLAWLTDVLERIPEHKANKLEELLPQNWKPQNPPQ